MSRLPRAARWALAIAGLGFLPACAMASLPPWDWPAALPQAIRDLAPQARSASTQPVKSTAVSSPSAAGASYVLVFDSRMTTEVVYGVEHVRATVPLVPQGDPTELSGEAPLQIVSADGDQRGGGSCTNNDFNERPGTLRVASAKITTEPGGSLTGLDLVYSLNPQVKCGDGSFRPNDWNLFWMVYDGHFTHTDDKLDDSGSEPLITVGHWDFHGPSARRVYHWQSAAAIEDTTITLDPATP